MKEVDSAVGSARLRSNMLRRDMAPPEGPSNGAGQRAGKCRGDGAKQSGATTCRGGWQRRCATSWPRCWPTASTWEDGGGEWAWEAACECLLARQERADRFWASGLRRKNVALQESHLHHYCRGTSTHCVARKSHTDTIAAHGLRQRGGRSSVFFFVSTRSHVASRGSGGGATAAKRTRLDADTVLHTFNALCAVRSCCLATDGAARCSAAGERLIAGHRPTVFGRIASAGAESDCVLEVLECSLTPWAPRSDLYHRSGRGAF